MNLLAVMIAAGAYESVDADDGAAAQAPVPQPSPPLSSLSSLAPLVDNDGSGGGGGGAIVSWEEVLYPLYYKPFVFADRKEETYLREDVDNYGNRDDIEKIYFDLFEIQADPVGRKLNLVELNIIEEYIDYVHQHGDIMLDILEYIAWRSGDDDYDDDEEEDEEEELSLIHI